MRKRYLVSAASAALVAGLVAAGGATAKSDLNMHVVYAGPKGGGGEPSLAISPDGAMYASYPGSDTKTGGKGMNLVVSGDGGEKWRPATSPATSSGDTSVNVDPTGAVYESNLNGIKANPNALQVDVYKSFDRGQSWPVHGASTIEGNANSSGQPFLVDRQWTDTAIPPGKTTDQAIVAMEYHDWGPGLVWVSTSTDGGKSYGAPVNVVTSPVAAQASICDTIPGGMKIVPYAKGQKHPGRMYAAWLAADGANNLATGCNETQMAAFHSVWVAYSDDNGQTWTDTLVFDGGPLHDGSEIFADLTLDNVGNPYIAFTMNLVQDFDVWVTDSLDGGATWLKPVKASGDSAETHMRTHYFPAIGAGDPGKVFVSYIATDTAVPTAPWGKPMPGADNNADWYVWAAQSLNLNGVSPTFTNTQVTQKSIHHGDVCTLGIFCSAVPNANRNLLDFIDAQVDRDGRGHVVFTGDSTDFMGIFAANQEGGTKIGRGGH